MWFSCYRGLIKYDGNSFTSFTKDDGLLNNEIWSFIIDSKGIFWIGTNEGVSRFDGKAFTTFSIPKALVKDPNRFIRQTGLQVLQKIEMVMCGLVQMDLDYVNTTGKPIHFSQQQTVFQIMLFTN